MIQAGAENNTTPQYPRISIRVPRIVRISRTYRPAVSISVALIVFLGGGVMDWLVVRGFLPPISLPLGGAAVGACTGLLVFLVLGKVHEHYQFLEHRLRQVAELNHHIRNALQIISYNNVPDRGEEGFQQVRTAVGRIESVLREISESAPCSPSERSDSYQHDFAGPGLI